MRSGFRPGCALAAVLLTSVGSGGCRDRTAATATSGLPNIVLVSIDTLRADHTSAYGYPIDTTPVLRRLAAEGLLFRRAYSASATTAPSHAALLTGRAPRSLGVLKNGHVLDERFTTLAEVLSRAGYQTAAFVSSRPVSRIYGFGQGFDRFDEPKAKRKPTGRNRALVRDRRAADTANALRAWLQRRRDERPVFVWLHLFDPHAPYTAPEAFRGRWPAGTPSHVTRYDEEIRYADKHLGSMLESFDGIAGPAGTIVVVTADHGEALGEHNHRGHGVNLHEESVRIPLILAWRGHIAGGEAREGPATSVDVASTILALAGIELPEEFEGHDLREPVEADRAIFLQRREYRSRRDRGTKVLGDMLAVVQGPWKFIRAAAENRYELYDSVADPAEQRDLGAENAAKREALDTLLEKWIAEHPPPDLAQPELSTNEKRALRALGYVD